MMLKVAIRDYKDKDWSVVEEMILKAENFGPPFLEYERKRIAMYKAFSEFGKVLVAEHPTTKEVVGYVTIEVRRRALAIMSIITHHNYLRKGIGRQMIEKIKVIGEDYPEIDVIRVELRDFMDYAQQFYLSCGFQISGYVSHDVGWSIHHVHFAYPLKGVERSNN
ncbi:MAG: GNAT family N-acetyltransferase [Candidatus Hermodarchaeota archaeon]